MTTINKAALPLQSSRMEKRAVVFFCGLKDIMQMLFTVKCVQGMLSNGPTKKMLGGQKFVSDMEVPWAVRQCLAQQPTSCFYMGHSQSCLKIRQMFK